MDVSRLNGNTSVQTNQMVGNKSAANGLQKTTLSHMNNVVSSLGRMSARVDISAAGQSLSKDLSSMSVDEQKATLLKQASDIGDRLSKTMQGMNSGALSVTKGTNLGALIKSTDMLSEMFSFQRNIGAGVGPSGTNEFDLAKSQKALEQFSSSAEDLMSSFGQRSQVGQAALAQANQAPGKILDLMR